MNGTTSRRVRWQTFIPPYAATVAFGLTAGFFGGLFGSDGRRFVPDGASSSIVVAFAGVVVGAMVGLPQTIFVYRASGRGRLWVAGTSTGAAAAMGAFMIFLDASPLPEWSVNVQVVVAFTMMGALVGAGQALTVPSWRMSLYPLVCCLSLAAWFPIFALVQEPGFQWSFLVGALLASVVSAMPISVALYFCLPRPPAASP